MELCLNLAIMIFAGLILGKAARSCHVPMVTGYIIAGVLIGPSMLNWITLEGLHGVTVIAEITLVTIMFMIGTEFESSQMRRVGRGIIKIALYDAVITFLAVALLCAGAGFLALSELNNTEIIQLGMMLGALAIATAPAATLLVIKEYESEGPVSEHILALVALNNLICVVFFYIIFIFSGAGGNLGLGNALLQLLIEVPGSMVVGIAVGLLVSFLDRKIFGKEQMVVTIGGILLITALGWKLGISSMLASLVFGVIFVNAAIDPRKVTDEVYHTALPLYVVFFVIAGAELQVNALTSVGLIGAAYIIGRVVAKWAGIYAGSAAANAPDNIKRYLGVGMFCQAGVVIGLVNVAVNHSGRIGEIAQTTILAAVLVFEIIGPWFVKLSVVKSGEVKLVNLMGREGGDVDRSGVLAIFGSLMRAMGIYSLRKPVSLENLQVRHVMRQSVKPIRDNATLDEVVHFVEHSKYNHFPVVDENQKLKGVISFTDIRDVLFDESLASLVIASDIAHADVPRVYPDDSLDDALQKFTDSEFGCLPVVDPKDFDKLIGLLEQRSVLRLARVTRRDQPLEDSEESPMSASD